MVRNRNMRACMREARVELAPRQGLTLVLRLCVCLLVALRL